MRLFTKRAVKVRSQRPGFLNTLRRELRDYYYEYEGRIDTVSLLLPVSIGALFGLLVSLSLESDGEPLVVADTLLWALSALGLAAAGSFALVACITLSLSIVIGVEILRENSSPRRGLRRSIRDNIRQLKEAVVNDRIPLRNLESVRVSLRLRDGSAERSGTGWYERILVNRWRRERERVEGLLEVSWQESLPEALAYLTETADAVIRSRPSAADLKETTEVAWYLAGNPVDVAVQRLLYEYLPTERKNGNGYLEFRAGVVYTPRWVYELAKLAEQSARSRAAEPWSFRFDGRAGRYGTVGNECVPIGDVDRETVEKLYEPRGEGPLGSLRETVETARNV